MQSTFKRSWIGNFSSGRCVSDSCFARLAVICALFFLAFNRSCLCAFFRNTLHLHSIFVQARETGICPVREELYSQTFDELIRQVAINCSERGLLLLRVRDEIRMTISAYQTLYESSVAFGMRKALQAEQGKSDMEAKIKQLESEKKELERQVQDQKARSEAIEKREAERRTLEEKKHNEEVAFLKRSHQQLKQQLESVLAPSAPAAKK